MEELEFLLKLLALFGGSTGFFYWYDRIKNRARLKIRISDLGIFAKKNEPAYIKFEAENLGLLPMSLKPTIIVKGHCLNNNGRFYNKQKIRIYTYSIIDADRHLAPRKARILTAKCDATNISQSLWFMVYIFTPTIGWKCRIRIRSALGTHLSYLKYDYELFLSRWFGDKFLHIDD